MKLRIDVGRVLISPGDESRADTSFIGATLEDALSTPPNEGMFDVVPALVGRFGRQVWIISKCGERIQERTMQWFERHRFFERTGIDRRKVRFCRKRPEKAMLCRELAMTHFIDDRADVLDAMAGVVANRYLFGPQPAPAARGVRHVATWEEVAREFL